MKLILDNNVLFSLLKPDSSASKIFEFIDAEFIAPSFILHESAKYEEECLKKSKLPKEKFNERKQKIFSQIKFIEFSEYTSFIEEAVKNIPDKDDAPYFALALKTKLPVWSNDKELKKQDKVTVLSTEDLIQILF
jgi:predicted nucleic acid-binding protein